MKTQETDAPLNYAVYDRQLEIFLLLVEEFTKGWQDYGALELSMDIHSLCRKGARLFYMADQDWVEQQKDLTMERFQKNAHYLDGFERLVSDLLGPAMLRISKEMREGNKLEGKKLPYYTGNMTDVLPQLEGMLTSDGMEPQNYGSLYEAVTQVQGMMQKVKPKTYPGETSVERFWNLCRLLAYSCYLNYHFQRCVERKSHKISEEELEHLFGEIIQAYANSEEGEKILRTYKTRLLFENDGCPLSLEQIHAEEKNLVRELPESLQYCFMTYYREPGKMAYEIVHGQHSSEELQALTVVVAKNNVLQCMKYELEHPAQVKDELFNEVFQDQVNGKPVDLFELRTQIEQMVKLVERKNQWFCVWCVLKYHRLLKNMQFEAFSRQMMHPDWFGNAHVPTFTGDNLSDYKGYFTDNYFKVWNKKSYDYYRSSHDKKKWSNALFSTFYTLTTRMNDAFEGL